MRSPTRSSQAGKASNERWLRLVEGLAERTRTVNGQPGALAFDALPGLIAREPQTFPVDYLGLFDLVSRLASFEMEVVATHLRRPGANGEPEEVGGLFAHIAGLIEGCRKIGVEAARRNWAGHAGNLAVDLRRRAEASTGPEAKQLVESSIEIYRQLFAVYTRQAAPSEWALVNMNLGNSLSLQGDRTGDNGKLHEAIASYNAASSVFSLASSPSLWAKTKVNLGGALQLLGDRESGPNGVRHIRKAVATYRSTMKVYKRRTTPGEWAQAQMFLAVAESRLGQRIGGTPGLRSFEAAAKAYRQAEDVYRRIGDRLNWARCRLNLGIALARRSERVGQAEAVRLLEDAAVAFRSAAAIFGEDGNRIEWARAQMNLGNALTAHGERTRDAGKQRLFRAAVKAQRVALTVVKKRAMRVEWARTRMNLGSALLRLGEVIRGTTGVRLMRQAISAYGSAMRVFSATETPGDLALARLNLAIASASVVEEEGRAAADTRPEWRHVANELTAAVSLLRDTVGPAMHVDAARRLARIWSRLSDWRKVVEVAASILSTFDTFFAEADDEHQRETLLLSISGLGTLAAEACVRVEDIGRALALLEFGRGVQLRDGLDLEAQAVVELRERNRAEHAALLEAQQAVRIARNDLMAAHQSGDPVLVDAQRVALNEERDQLMRLRRRCGLEYSLEPTVDIVGTIPEGGALVVLFATEATAFALVIPAESSPSPEHVLELDGCSAATLRGHRDAWFKISSQLTDVTVGYSETLPDAEARASERLSTLLDWLWVTVMGPIAGHLAMLGITPASISDVSAPEILIVPTGDFAPMPLQAAWRQVGGGKRCFLDEYAVTSAPTVEIARKCQARARAQDAAEGALRLLAFVDPDHHRSAPLSASREIEGPGLKQLFEQGNRGNAAKVVTGGDATKTALIHEYRSFRPTHLHLACHGGFRRDDPAGSGLLLANADILSARDVIARLSSEEVRSVVLPACETGMSDVDVMPDEAFGLVAAFMAAGIPFALASLWAVLDRPTAVFVLGYYDRYLKGREAASGGTPFGPAQAFRQTVLWFRDLSEEQVGDLCDAPWHEQDLDGRTGLLEALGARFEQRNQAESKPPQRRTRALKERGPERSEHDRARQAAVPGLSPLRWAGFICSGF